MTLTRSAPIQIATIEAASRRAEIRQADMAPCANALVNRAHDLLGIVFQELLDALRIHSCNVEIRGMMHMHRPCDAAVSVDHAPESRGGAGGHDHFALVNPGDHI